MNNKSSKNYMLRFFLLLLFVAMGCIGMYFIPEKTKAFTIAGINIPSISLTSLDILSDIRKVEPDRLLDDSYLTGNTDIHKSRAKESKKKDNNTSINKGSSTKNDESREDNSNIVLFKDFSKDKRAFYPIYEAIKNRDNINRPIRIAFLGDSFIEGDVFTEGVRKQLQKTYGGSGVGWLPMASSISGFRNSVNIIGSGWVVHSFLNETKEDKFTISGEYFLLDRPTARTIYSLPSNSTTTNAILYYTASGETEAEVKINREKYNNINLEASENLISKKIIKNRTFNKIQFSVDSTDAAFSCYGMAIESDSGIVVDCFPIRGHSGLALSTIDAKVNKEFLKLRAYDLIVLEYGLNVANKNQKDYSSYRNSMVRIVNKIKSETPQSTIMIMGVSERGQRIDGEIKTMPAALSLEREQAEIAKETGSLFWSTRLGVKKIGGIEKLAHKGLADKDYTHLSHKGGNMLASEWVKAFDAEVNYYEEMEK